jgi:hypothetical protein
VALQTVPDRSPHPAQAHRFLAVLARYLDENARTGRSLGNRPLSGTDIVLHELWPLAGQRPRAVALTVLTRSGSA